MLHAFLLSFGVIFVAELGDKSQLMALAFATRYKTVPVLIAITLATGIVHLFSVALGGAIGTALPTKLISITTEGLVGTWAGSTIGMVVADGLAIAVGKALGDRLQAKTVRIASSIAFFVFAAIMFADALR